uniref:Uncharacterized protein n=1 Tax=Arundo donax TaxID=35708 RepID=A0A0A9BHQ3_ARUDO
MFKEKEFSSCDFFSQYYDEQPRPDGDRTWVRIQELEAT